MRVAVWLLPVDSVTTASTASFRCQIPSQLLWLCCVQVVREVAGRNLGGPLVGWLIRIASMQEVQEDPAGNGTGM